MNKQSTGIFILLFSISTLAHAQLGSLINKVKNKPTEAKQGNANNPGTATSSAHVAPATVSTANAVASKRTDTEFEMAEDIGYTSSTARYNYDMLTRYFKTLGPYAHIRKVGEQGNNSLRQRLPGVERDHRTGDQKCNHQLFLKAL